MLRTRISVVILLGRLCFCRVVNTVSDLPPTSFDFIVIGGGTAGNVAANRLTENSNLSVLVIEAGPSHENVLELEVPAFAPRATPDTAWDWNFTTAPQETLNGRVLQYPRGHVLGGCSSTNYMTYTRGTKEDYDRYAHILQDNSFSWDAMQTYFLKNEMLTSPADHHDTFGEIRPADHGSSGIVGDSLPGFPQAIDGRIIQTTRELPDFHYNEDVNSGYHLGIGWQVATVKNGSRSSSATSYLAEKFLRRPNLHVLLNSQVTRLHRTPSTRAPTFLSVELTSLGVSWILNATKEVIMCSGALNTPQILMTSGIGNRSMLAASGIPTHVDLPSVGQNLTEHPLVFLTWLVNNTNTSDTAARNATLATEQLQQWNATRSGPLVDNVMNQFAWLRLPQNATIFQQFNDPAAGPNSAHFEFIFTNGFFGGVPLTGNYLTIAVGLVSPLSRGSVTLNSSAPQGPPSIDLNFYSSEFDIFTMREGLRSARRFVASPVWSDYIISPLTNASTDGELDQYIRANSVPIFHASGTASMSPKSANWGVINPDFTVKSINGLRIVDASVFPRIPTAHTATPVYAFAEKAADAIKRTWA